MSDAYITANIDMARLNAAGDEMETQVMLERSYCRASMVLEPSTSRTRKLNLCTYISQITVEKQYGFILRIIHCKKLL